MHARDRGYSCEATDTVGTTNDEDAGRPAGQGEGLAPAAATCTHARTHAY
jgi:hypothetical protein